MIILDPEEDGRVPTNTSLNQGMQYESLHVNLILMIVY